MDNLNTPSLRWELGSYLMATVTVLATLPSAMSTISTSPLPASEAGRGPMLIWSKPTNSPCGTAPRTGVRQICDAQAARARLSQ